MGAIGRDQGPYEVSYEAQNRERGVRDRHRRGRRCPMHFVAEGNTHIILVLESNLDLELSGSESHVRRALRFPGVHEASHREQHPLGDQEHRSIADTQSLAANVGPQLPLEE